MKTIKYKEKQQSYQQRDFHQMKKAVKKDRSKPCIVLGCNKGKEGKRGGGISKTCPSNEFQGKS